jgi:hypothetical protein
MQHFSSALPGAFEIAGYISPNITPEVLIACGPDAEIEEFAERIGQLECATIVARASDGTTAFLKAHLQALLYRDFIDLMASCPPHVETPVVRRACPSRDDGRTEDVGNPHAPPVIVGVLADPQALEAIKAHLSWARCQPLNLAHAGRGFLFEPQEDDIDAYGAFVRDAAAGYYANAVVALLKRT